MHWIGNQCCLPPSTRTRRQELAVTKAEVVDVKAEVKELKR